MPTQGHPGASSTSTHPCAAPSGAPIVLAMTTPAPAETTATTKKRPAPHKGTTRNKKYPAKPVNGLTWGQALPCTVEDVQHVGTLPVWSQTEPSAAGLLSCSKETAYAMAKAGTLPIIKLGPKKIRVAAPALLRMLGAGLPPVVPAQYEDLDYGA